MTDLIVDLFAGGGGASEGIRMALGRDSDIAVNHDEDAVAGRLTKTAQVRLIGNSVSPPVAAAVIRAQFPASQRKAA